MFRKTNKPKADPAEVDNAMVGEAIAAVLKMHEELKNVPYMENAAELVSEVDEEQRLKDKSTRDAFHKQYQDDKRAVAKVAKGLVDCIGVDKKTGEPTIVIAKTLHVPKDDKTTRYVVSGSAEYDELKAKL